jgi:cobaltochelatase CobS
MTIEELMGIINDPQTTPENIKLAQDLLDKEEKRLASIGAANIQTAMISGGGDDELNAILAGLEAALKGGGGKVSMADVRRAVNEELERRKINMGDLSPDLLAFLNSQRSVTFTLKTMSVSRTTNTTDEFLNRPLTQLILSDVMARNNVYLYGGAGTGKTFVAETLADLLGWKLITLNCNQFTSPLDILGGQTIDGYQEGKLSMAWKNQINNPDGTITNVDGCVLLLDELPKIDPNTAGILNDALAKVKSYKFRDGKLIPPKIQNGRNEDLTLGNMFVIATGNVPLNTIDPDYEANFKQDLSLQDRFIGSTYEIFVDYQVEWDNVGKGYAFIWLFLVKVREKIKELRATNQAFVSLRLMINVIETYKVYRTVLGNNQNKVGALSSDAVTRPKTVKDAMDNFFNLFKSAPKQSILQAVDYPAFLKLVEEKDKMPFNPDGLNNFDTPEEVEEAQKLIRKNQEEIRRKYNS